MATSRKTRRATKVEQGKGTGKSGWCLTSEGDHENCKYRLCSCGCHQRGDGSAVA